MMNEDLQKMKELVEKYRLVVCSGAHDGTREYSAAISRLESCSKALEIILNKKASVLDVYCTKTYQDYLSFMNRITNDVRYILNEWEYKFLKVFLKDFCK